MNKLTPSPLVSSKDVQCCPGESDPICVPSRRAAGCLGSTRPTMKVLSAEEAPASGAWTGDRVWE